MGVFTLAGPLSPTAGRGAQEPTEHRDLGEHERCVGHPGATPLMSCAAAVRVWSVLPEALRSRHFTSSACGVMLYAVERRRKPILW